MKKANKTYDLIIVGGGPAGITAGIYAGRQGLKVLLITKTFGSQMARKAVDIENWPGIEKIPGLELIQNFEKHLRKQKIDIEIDSVVKIEKVGKEFLILTGSKNNLQTRAVIVASGTDPRPLEVAGEKEFIGKGVSYCVTCDGPLFAGKEVAVAGGGNAGFEAAISLANYVKKVYILEYGSAVKADAQNQAIAKKTGKVEVLANAILKKIQGKDFLESVIYQDRQSQELKTLKVEGIFVEIGSQPATSFVKGLVDFNEKDEIAVNPHTGETSTEGLFAAGDADDVPYKQIVIAAGEGAKAALSAAAYLQKQ